MKRSTTALILALAAIMATPAFAVGADPADEIPGVPLPGAIATGRLGGPIYDRVYWVDVPAQRVLVASLTGSPGTDFDLYLFDGSATSVYAETGLVAKSTGPTSTEVIAHPSPGGGRYYIDLSGFTEVQGDYRLTVQIATDSTPPRMSLALDGGAPATAQPDVSVTVIAIDDLSGVDAVQFSPDGQTWGPVAGLHVEGRLVLHRIGRDEDAVGSSPGSPGQRLHSRPGIDRPRPCGTDHHRPLP